MEALIAAAVSSDIESHFVAEVRSTLESLQGNPLAQALLRAVSAIESGETVQLSNDVEREISPQQASTIIGISRPHLYKLLDTGVIPEQPRVGTHRKIKMRDIQAFIHNRERASRQLAIDIANTQQAQDQLVRDGAGVSAAKAAKFGF